MPFLKKVGFNPKKDIHFMPCSGLTGANLKEPVEHCAWYTYVQHANVTPSHHDQSHDCQMLMSLLFPFFIHRGLPFIPHLDNLPNLNRSSDGPVRLPIVDKYKVSPALFDLLSVMVETLPTNHFCSLQDMGTVILGKLESGSISKAQQLVMMPNRVSLIMARCSDYEPALVV